MRRSILFGISLLALSIPGWADKVTPEQAAAVAERFLSAESPVTKSSQGAIRLTGTWPEARTKSAAQEPALYLFERDGGGFVVMAADDVSQPVIGYSTTARLSNGEMPCNLRYILDWHASMIDYARTKGLAASSATKAQWQSTKGNEGEEVHLETAQWDQEGLPWNAMIPKVGGEECPVGCVATAIAIIMRYHQWPNKGTGTLPGYYWPGGGMEMEALALDHEYDWSQMPLIYEPGQQSANAYMEFHPGQKITDLVSLDFSLGDVDYPEDPEDPYLYLRGVKEIYWKMWSEDKGVCLATSQSTYSEQVIDGKSYKMGLRWDRDKNEFRAVFQYEPGNYRLFLRNFDEEMTLYIKL